MVQRLAYARQPHGTYYGGADSADHRHRVSQYPVRRADGGPFTDGVLLPRASDNSALQGIGDLGGGRIGSRAASAPRVLPSFFPLFQAISAIGPAGQEDALGLVGDCLGNKLTLLVGFSWAL